MTTKTERPQIDKSKWGPGPWQDEPDRVEFKHAGLPCLLVRQRESGHWCGYAAVPPGHPCHGHDYAGYAADGAPEPPSVHGGVTYSEACAGEVCHVPKPGEPDNVFWLGFDCNHSGDVSPRRAHDRDFGPGPYDMYRDVEYVRRETELLAEGLAEMGGASR